jgi:anti-sigma factor RsiW
MMSEDPPITDAELHAYVDGQLAAGRMDAVQAALRRDADLAARATAYRAQNAALRDALEPWLDETVPANLLAAAAPRRGFGGAGWKTYGGWAAMLVLGIALGWGTRELTLERAGVPTTFARQAAFTHALYAVDARRPVEVAASEEQSLVTWLTKRTGRQARAPDLAQDGYHLVGGRLVAGNETPTALLMYENGAGQRLTLQWRPLPPDTGEAAFRYAVENGVGVFYWVDASCAYALSGTIDRSNLLAVAHAVYDQLAVPAPAASAPH